MRKNSGVYYYWRATVDSEWKCDEGGLRFIDFDFPFYEPLRSTVEVEGLQ